MFASRTTRLSLALGYYHAIPLGLRGTSSIRPVQRELSLPPMVPYEGILPAAVPAGDGILVDVQIDIMDDFLDGLVL